MQWGNYHIELNENDMKEELEWFDLVLSVIRGRMFLEQA